ncbi:MAG TPA: SagB/ThcOx family dehydrogenase [Anaerolineales bacterium]|nr:SagB/ThcOx family dehydrogenase [Anaerolineales bacterium]
MFTHFRRQQPVRETTTGGIIVLPEPDRESKTSLEKALQDRRSIRSYSDQALALAEVGQLLWAAQGVNRPGGYRTAPSAGALYPLEIYLLAGQVEDLAAGLFHYLPENHALEHVWSGDRQVSLSEAALGQDSIARAPAVIVIAAIYQRTKGKYGQRGERYVHMEAGSAAQNIYLQAVSLELGTVFIGAFYDEQVQNVLGLSKDEIPLCLMPVGHPDE